MVFFFQKPPLYLVLKFYIFCSSFLIQAQNHNKINAQFEAFDENLYFNLHIAENIAIEAVDVYEYNNNDVNGLFRAYNNLIRIKKLKRDYIGVKTVINKAIKIEEEVTEERYKVDLYNAIAYKEGKEFNFYRAYTYSEKAIALSNKLKDSLRLSTSLVEKAGLYISNQEFKEAKEYLKKAEYIAKRREDYNVLSDVYLYLAEANYLEDKEKALFYYNKGLNAAIKAKNKFKQAVVYSNLGFFNAYYSNLDNVLDLLEKSKILSHEVNSEITLHNIYYTLGYYFELKGDYNKAINNYNIALKKYGGNIGGIQLCNIYIMLSSALWHNNNFAEAYDFQQKYIELNDSLFNSQKAKEFNNIRTKYEVEKKDAAIALLEKENEIEETRKKWLGASAIFLLLVLLGVFLFFRHRIKTKNIILFQEKELHNKEMEQSIKEKELTEIKAYINGQEKERNRLAKELHDGIGGQLASINLSLTHINTELKNDSIKKVSNNLVSSFKELRALSHSLSANTFKGKTFKTLLRDLKILHEQNNDLKIDVSIYPNDILDDLDSNITHNVYRILQELLTNVTKHAKANFIEISFNKHDNVLVIIMEDDGCGFEVEGKNYGIGIKNIEERILTLHGSFNIDSQINKGTQVIVEVPVNTQDVKCIR
jgi:signal transduction histidine kinase